MARRKKIDTGDKPTAMEVIWEYAQAILLAVVLALIVRWVLVQPFHIPSGSMEKTFLEGDRVLVNKYVYGIRNPFTNKIVMEIDRPERWDVVVFIAPDEPDKDYVKRVVGLPGETLALTNGELFINGAKIADNPHAHYDNSSLSLSARNFGPTLLKEDEYFMMGDNRDNSRDSRYFGAVNISAMRGRAWRLYWSWDSKDPDLSFFERFRVSRIGALVE